LGGNQQKNKMMREIDIMAIQFGVKGMLQEVGKVGFSMVTGGGIVLASLLAWTGAEDLEAIKTAVNNSTQQSNLFVGDLSTEYLVEVNKANAEIGEYKDALEQANSNITTLITAYETKALELEQAQTEMANMLTQAEANEIIAKANEEIQSANDAVAEAKTQVEHITNGSISEQYKDNLDGYIDQRANDLSTLSKEDLEGLGYDLGSADSLSDTTVETGGDKTVTSIDGVIGEVVEGE
jgi:DNA repair exonuclease SbcCD ATPase subunit